METQQRTKWTNVCRNKVIKTYSHFITKHNSLSLCKMVALTHNWNHLFLFNAKLFITNNAKFQVKLFSCILKLQYYHFGVEWPNLAQISPFKKASKFVDHTSLCLYERKCAVCHTLWSDKQLMRWLTTSQSFAVLCCQPICARAEKGLLPSTAGTNTAGQLLPTNSNSVSSVLSCRASANIVSLCAQYVWLWAHMCSQHLLELVVEFHYNQMNINAEH